jgi:putative peptidoglycan lipid II flippase
MHGEHRQLLSRIKVTSLGTLASRVLGMFRDMATASLLGLSGGAMDALVVAFRIPNLMRGLFGEGALATSFMPLLALRLEEGRDAAWRFVSATLIWLSLFLVGTTVAGEVLLGLVWWACPDRPELTLLLQLSAVLLPYMIFVCVAAQLTAALQTLGRFSLPAIAPCLLSIIWLLAAWLVAPRFEPDKGAQALVLAAAILLSGLLQLVVQVPLLIRLGFRPTFPWRASWGAAKTTLAVMGPTLLGMSIGRLNTLLDGLMAWGLAPRGEGGSTFDVFGTTLRYPLEAGAAAAIYCAERLCHLPVGLVGVAVATVLFPLLSRHAARGDRGEVGRALNHALRLVLCLAIPASAGLMLLAEPLTRLLFERGNFSAADTARTARIIAAYACGVWAWCALPVLLRGYYALEDRTTPLRVGGCVVAANVVLNFSLIWPLGEIALPVSTAIGAIVQTLCLAIAFHRRLAPLDWPALLRTAAKASLAAGFMFLAGRGVLWGLPPLPGMVNELVRVAGPLLICLLVYGVCFRLVGDREVYARP